MATVGQPEQVEGYERFFGLNEPPFSLAPDPRFLFASASHSAALAQVAYAVERREPLVVITGEIGAGKTLLCRTVLQRLHRKTFLSVINDPLLRRDDLLKQLLEDFGVISKDRTRLGEASRHDLVRTLHAFLSSLTPIQAHAVVIIDEAQHLQPDVLEQIRLLSNIDDARGTLLQIILVGQTDLAPLLARPELRQLQQRVSRRFPLEPLTRDEVEQYIEHRLALARDNRPSSQFPGATELRQELAEWTGTKEGVEFTSEAIQLVSELSIGVPRVINVLCDRALEEAYASRLRVIDRRVIEAAAAAAGIGAQSTPRPEAHPNTTALVEDLRPGEPVELATRFDFPTESAIDPPADEATVGLIARTRPAAPSSLSRFAALAALVALVSAGILFSVHAGRSPAVEPPSTGAPSSPGAAGAPADSTPADPGSTSSNTLAPNAAATAGTPAPAQAPAPTSSAVGAQATPGRFEIVVASFRTDARATSVAAEVAALGLPTSRRVSDGWQQVVCGPFASRTDAEEAQQRIHRAGLTGTQIGPAGR